MSSSMLHLLCLLCKLLKFDYLNFAVNSDECLMTRMQEMSLDYHFTVEQEVGSSTYAFFGFNGTKLLTSFWLLHFFTVF